MLSSMARSSRSPHERFWDHVTPGFPDECWVWPGAVNGSGYGFLHGDREHRWVLAHRISWEIHNGPIPVGKNVLHTCDNPPCVNPAHLYVGTKKDNALDRSSRGRGRENRQQGEANTNAKLTEAEAKAVIALLATGRSQMEVGRMLGISQQQVSRIANRRSWAHVWDE